MKTTHVLLFLLMIISLSESLFSQEKLIEGILYKDAKIITENGNMLRANFIYENDSINIFLKNPTMEFQESIQKISRIEIKSKRSGKNIIIGTAIGVGVGLAISYTLYKKGYSEPIQALTLVSPAAIGFLIGFSSKAFKPIYSNDQNVLNKFDYGIYYDTALENLNFNLSFSF